jgi:hypothetical protein
VCQCVAGRARTCRLAQLLRPGAGGTLAGYELVHAHVNELGAAGGVLGGGGGEPGDGCCHGVGQVRDESHHVAQAERLAHDGMHGGHEGGGTERGHCSTLQGGDRRRVRQQSSVIQAVDNGARMLLRGGLWLQQQLRVSGSCDAEVRVGGSLHEDEVEGEGMGQGGGARGLRQRGGG